MSRSIDARFARDVLRRLHAAVNAHDPQAIGALCSENVRWEDPAAQEPLYGRDAVLRFHRDVMFRALPDVRVQLVDGPYLALDGTAVAVRLRIAGTMSGPLNPPGFAPTFGPVSFETAEFSRFEDGLLAHHHVVFDGLALARQIGALPRVGTFADRVGTWLQPCRARSNLAGRTDGSFPGVRADPP